MMTEAEVLRHLKDIVDMSELEAIWDRLCNVLSEFGFTHLLYGANRIRVNPNRITQSDKEDALVLSNHCDEYLTRFVSEGHYMHAPNLLWALQNVGVCSWQDVGIGQDSKTLSKEALAVVKFNRDLGFFGGYTISFQEPSYRAAAAIGLTSPNVSQNRMDRIWAEHGHLIELITNVAHLQMRALPSKNQSMYLTHRQIEVLELVADGKTVQDIAKMLDRTSATVEKHLRLARQAMQAETTAQAILKAAVRNQLFLPE